MGKMGEKGKEENGRNMLKKRAERRAKTVPGSTQVRCKENMLRRNKSSAAP